MNSGDKVFELDRPTRDCLDAVIFTRLDDAVMARARSGFQYRYETLRIADSVASRTSALADDLLYGFARWLSTDGPLDFLRQVTGADDVRFAACRAPPTRPATP